MRQSDTIKELATALSSFQGKITSVSKDSINPFFKMKYASLNSIWEHIREPLSNCGLSVVQGGEPEFSEGHMVVNTLLLHTSGEWILSSLPIKPTKEKDGKLLDNDSPQGIGSAITYARRYGLSAILGLVADEDDDGEVSQARQKVETKAPQETKQEATPPPTESQSNPFEPESNAVDHNWLKETLGIIKWKEGTALSWIKAQLKVPAKGSLPEVLNSLDKAQLKIFVDHISSMRSASGF